MLILIFLCFLFTPLSGEVVGFCQEMHHQELWHPLAIKICYQSDDGSLDPAQVKQCAARFLNSYPNEKDFWEIMNVKMASCLIQKYPSMRSLDIEIAISPDDYVPFYRKSLLKYREGRFEEYFSFVYEKPLRLEVWYTYKEEIRPEEYPDFRLIYHALDQFAHEMLTLDWETLRPLLIEHLLGQFPMLSTLDLQF